MTEGNPTKWEAAEVTKDLRPTMSESASNARNEQIKSLATLKIKGLDNLNIVHQSLIIFTEKSLSNFPKTANSTRFFETLLPFLKATTGNQKGYLETLLSFLLTVNRNSGRSAELFEFQASVAYTGQPGVHMETLSQNKQK